MIGTTKKEVREFVEQSVASYKNSTGYAVIGCIPEAQQEFINGKLYELYKDAERSSSSDTLSLLKEVMEEYSGFSSYFSQRQSKPQARTPDLPWSDYVGNPAARRCWGLDNDSRPRPSWLSGMPRSC